MALPACFEEPRGSFDPTPGDCEALLDFQPAELEQGLQRIPAVLDLAVHAPDLQPAECESIDGTVCENSIHSCGLSLGAPVGRSYLVTMAVINPGVVGVPVYFADLEGDCDNLTGLGPLFESAATEDVYVAAETTYFFDVAVGRSDVPCSSRLVVATGADSYGIEEGVLYVDFNYVQSEVTQ